MPQHKQGTLLLVLPVRLYVVDGRMFFDTQACNGLRLWLDNFESVALCAPVSVVAIQPPMTSEVKKILPTAHLMIHPLPAAWTPVECIRKMPGIVRLLNKLIAEASYLQFAIGGFWGDWPALAAILAIRKGRKAAIWTDRVESQVMAFQAMQHAGVRRLYRQLNAALAWQLERYVISKSAMGLFHGMDTYHTYSPLSQNPHMVHDIHLGSGSRILSAELAAKVGRTTNHPLKIVYGGRVHPDKGVQDWIQALGILKEKNVPFNATWFGDGPELAAARDAIAKLGLQACVEFPGPMETHGELMRVFRQADIFMFCHKTPESPRCLIEALLSGTPIVGYDSFYPRDLIINHGGGRLTANNPGALATAILEIAGSRHVLGDLAAAAAKDGHPLIDEEVFRHRSELIKSLS